jgi:hypothetical protein
LIEVKGLSKTETNNLKDILYNIFYRKQHNYCSMTQCFFPRNAILFYDKLGHLKEYILICFHCSMQEVSSNKIYFGSNCIQKMDNLQQFFISSGLKFGTDKTIELYPGEISDEQVK